MSGSYSIAGRAEPVAETPEGADHLIGDEQHAVPVADLAHPGEVALRRREGPTGVLHRFEVDGGDGLGPLHLDPLRDVVGAVERAGVEVGARVAAVAVGVAHLHRAGHERFERLADRWHPSDGERPEGRAVVRVVAAEDLRACGLSGAAEVLTGELPRRLDRLATASCEEGAGEVTRSELRQPGRQLDRRLVAVRPDREVGESFRLARRGLRQLSPSVAHLHREQSGEPVEVAPAVAIPDVAPLAALDDRDVAGRRQRGEVPPEVTAREVLQIVGSHAPRVLPTAAAPSSDPRRARPCRHRER